MSVVLGRNGSGNMSVVLGRNGSGNMFHPHDICVETSGWLKDYTVIQYKHREELISLKYSFYLNHLT